MLVLFLLEGLNGAVGALKTHAFQHLTHVFAEAVQVFAAKGVALGKLFGGQGALAGQTGQLVDAFNFFMFHGEFHPFGRLVEMVQGRWFVMGSDITLPMNIRRQVFGRGEDALDAMSQQVVVFEGDEAVGAARLWWADGAFQMGDVGVIEEKRGRGYGDLLVRLLLFKALTHNASLIALKTPKETEAFFAQYGFVSGGEEDGMIAMSIRGEDVQLSHCGGNCAECGHRSPECTPKALREN